MNTTKLLEVRNLKKYFFPKKRLLEASPAPILAVDEISFTLHEGETLGLVGESGCGKSTAARSLLRLIEPTAGQVTYRGKNLLNLKETEMRNLRKEMQIIFQDPHASVNPGRRIGKILGEPFEIHGFHDKTENAKNALQLLDQVGLAPDYLNRYPHELSGGQLQRVGIARAIALKPKLIVADEPVSALDVSIQAQVINLLLDMQENLGISYLFISHDLRVVEYFCDRIAVMYLGKFVEIADSQQIYNSPQHPYTHALLNAIPRLEPGHKQQKTSLKSEMPNLDLLQSGCSFHNRCPIKEKQCEENIPPLKEITPGHHVACFLKH
jgi:oligopeptide transport system ATP-binding protein